MAPVLTLQTVEMHPAYTEEELRRFEEELAAREAELNAKAQRLSQETEALGRSQGRLEALPLGWGRQETAPDHRRPCPPPNPGPAELGPRTGSWEKR